MNFKYFFVFVFSGLISFAQSYESYICFVGNSVKNSKSIFYITEFTQEKTFKFAYSNGVSTEISNEKTPASLLSKSAVVSKKERYTVYNYYPSNLTLKIDKGTMDGGFNFYNPSIYGNRFIKLKCHKK